MRGVPAGHAALRPAPLTRRLISALLRRTEGDTFSQRGGEGEAAAIALRREVPTRPTGSGRGYLCVCYASCVSFQVTATPP